ncbi:sensor histidine kinase [Dermacoccaceae bacterium W4C1]
MTSQPASTAPVTSAESRDPWEKYGWVMGAIWLVFLGFPFAALIGSDLPLAAQLLGTAVIIAFAAVYVHGMIAVDSAESWTQTHRDGRLHLLVMAALAAGLAVLIDVNALGTLPFMVSLAMFTLPLRRAIMLAALCMLVVLAAAWLADDWGAGVMFLGILAIVTVSVATVRIVDERAMRVRQFAEEQALSEERDRMARDVHDVIGHSLTVVTVKAELAERLIDLDPERAKAELAEIRSLSRQALAEVRATVSGLRVARLAEEVEGATTALAGAGIEATVPSDPEVVDPRHRIVLAWSLRELVTNVVRHSGAHRCEISWGEDWLSVADDGCGTARAKDGNGLRGMRERVSKAGGAIERSSGLDGTGTRMTVQL